MATMKSAKTERMTRIHKRLNEATAFFLKMGSPEAMLAKFTMDLADKYELVQEQTRKETEKKLRMYTMMKQQKLWYVKSSVGCLARKGEALKSDECGRFKEFSFLEELATGGKNGSRLHVKLLSGRGPQEGWVSPVVSEKAIVVKVSDKNEIAKIQAASFSKVFADLVAQDGQVSAEKRRLF